MGEKTLIPWCDSSGSPHSGCTKVSAGCDNCYAARQANRNLPHLGTWGPDGERKKMKGFWVDAQRWNDNPFTDEAGVTRRRRVFCGSICDVFEAHPAITWRGELWKLIDDTPNLDWLLLTKRPQNMGVMLPIDRYLVHNQPFENVWLGTSVENMAVARRVERLIQIPAKVHFLSIEPMLGPVHELDLTHIEWVIVGGESGPDYRDNPAWVSWAAAMRDRCRELGIAFFFKQSPGPKPGQGFVLDNEVIREFPEVAT